MMTKFHILFFPFLQWNRSSHAVAPKGQHRENRKGKKEHWEGKKERREERFRRKEEAQYAPDTHWSIIMFSHKILPNRHTLPVEFMQPLRRGLFRVAVSTSNAAGEVPREPEQGDRMVFLVGKRVLHLEF